MIKEIIKDFKEYRSHWNEFLFLRRFNMKLKLYSVLADMYRKATGKKTRVVIVGNDRKFEIWNRDSVKRMKLSKTETVKVVMTDGSIKKVKRVMPPRIPKSWGNIELNRITFYLTTDDNGMKLTPAEREEYRIKFNAYAKRFLK